jgi:hypothetical protein
MKHFEKIIFKPNPDTFDLAVEELKSFIHHYRQQLVNLIPWLQTDSQLQIQWENINHKPLAQVFPGNLQTYQLDSHPLHLGNGSEFTLDRKKQTITWINTNPIYSKDCLLFLDTIQNYKLWQPGSYATHQIGQGAKKSLKTYGWKNINYRKWFKKSTKI